MGSHTQISEFKIYWTYHGMYTVFVCSTQYVHGNVSKLSHNFRSFTAERLSKILTLL